MGSLGLSRLILASSPAIRFCSSPRSLSSLRSFETNDSAGWVVVFNGGFEDVFCCGLISWSLMSSKSFRKFELRLLLEVEELTDLVDSLPAVDLNCCYYLSRFYRVSLWDWPPKSVTCESCRVWSPESMIECKS